MEEVQLSPFMFFFDCFCFGIFFFFFFFFFCPPLPLFRASLDFDVFEEELCKDGEEFVEKEDGEEEEGPEEEEMFVEEGPLSDAR